VAKETIGTVVEPHTTENAMRYLNRLMLFVAATAFAACAEQGTLEPQQPDASFSVSGRGARHVTVMTRNMYIGADVDAAMAALANSDDSDDVPALYAALQTLQHTDLAARVRALAGEIAENRPQVVAIQEAYELTVDGSLLGMLGLPGGTIQVDYLQALQAALAARGLHYTLAGRNTTTDATVADGAVRIVDHDALLVDADHVMLQGEPIASVFQANIGPVAPGVSLQRGYVAAQATVDGISMLLVTSHFESGADPQIAGLRAMQASEVAQVIGTAPRVVLLGDLNGVAGSDMYQVLAGAGLVDTWAALRPREAGLTCCHSSDLSNRKPAFYERIDYVWTRGFSGPAGRVNGEIARTGDEPKDRVRGAFGLIWPSDHAGLVATFVLPASVLR
jgi:endonuclease/exonuclease/phosphatase family metal-dependent hydrolase